MNKNDNSKTQIYVIDDKKYTVISKCADNADDINKLNDLICKMVLKRINKQ